MNDRGFITVVVASRLIRAAGLGFLVAARQGALRATQAIGVPSILVPATARKGMAAVGKTGHSRLLIRVALYTRQLRGNAQ